MTVFFLAAAAMIVAALALILVPLLRRKPGAGQAAAAAPPATITGVVAAVGVPLIAAMLYFGNTNYPWRGVPPNTASQPTQSPTVAEAIAQIEARLTAQPDDATAWRMLGRAYVMAGEFPRAVTAYDRSMKLTGGADTTLRLDLAEALVLAGDPDAQERAGRILDEVLATEPANQKALWYSGVMALRANDVTTARKRLGDLRAQNPPAEIAGILDQQLAALDEGGVSAGGSKPTPATARGRIITVKVDVAAALAARVRPGVPLFVSARQPGIPGPPLAAVRFMSDALPLTVELSDANAMIEGRNLSTVDEVEVVARIAFGGTAMSAAGDLTGSTRSRRGKDEQVSITIDTEVR